MDGFQFIFLLRDSENDLIGVLRLLPWNTMLDVWSMFKGRTIRKVMGEGGGGGEFSSRRNFFSLSNSLYEFF